MLRLLMLHRCIFPAQGLLPQLLRVSDKEQVGDQGDGKANDPQQDVGLPPAHCVDHPSAQELHRSTTQSGAAEDVADDGGTLPDEPGRDDGADDSVGATAQDDAAQGGACPQHIHILCHPVHDKVDAAQHRSHTQQNTG